MCLIETLLKHKNISIYFVTVPNEYLYISFMHNPNLPLTATFCVVLFMLIAIVVYYIIPLISVAI